MIRNRIERARRREVFERADPKPARGILGPVPSVAEQTAALMQDPGWLVREMRRKQLAESDGPWDDLPDSDDWDDEDPDMFTGYQFIDMAPIPLPEDKAEATQTAEVSGADTPTPSESQTAETPATAVK